MHRIINSSHALFAGAHLPQSADEVRIAAACTAQYPKSTQRRNSGRADRGRRSAWRLDAGGGGDVVGNRNQHRGHLAFGLFPEEGQIAVRVAAEGARAQQRLNVGDKPPTCFFR